MTTVTSFLLLVSPEVVLRRLVELEVFVLDGMFVELVMFDEVVFVVFVVFVVLLVALEGGGVVFGPGLSNNALLLCILEPAQSEPPEFRLPEPGAGWEAVEGMWFEPMEKALLEDPELPEPREELAKEAVAILFVIDGPLKVVAVVERVWVAT